MALEEMTEQELNKYIYWVTEDFVFKDKVKSIIKYKYILEGQRLNNDGEIVVLNSNAANKYQQKLIVKLQNKIKSRQPTSGERWEQFMKDIIIAIKNYQEKEE